MWTDVFTQTGMAVIAKAWEMPKCPYSWITHYCRGVNCTVSKTKSVGKMESVGKPLMD